jgi:hypothetical protein
MCTTMHRGCQRLPDTHRFTVGCQGCQTPTVSPLVARLLDTHGVQTGLPDTHRFTVGGVLTPPIPPPIHGLPDTHGVQTGLPDTHRFTVGCQVARHPRSSDGVARHPPFHRWWSSDTPDPHGLPDTHGVQTGLPEGCQRRVQTPTTSSDTRDPHDPRVQTPAIPTIPRSP